jgi:ppGpp synthetase/RelA/SpoT-type nucleotidyltranferase
MSHAPLPEAFDAHRRALEETAARLGGELEARLREAAVPVHFVASRVKTRESLARKPARPDRTCRALWDVTDLVGLRVATYFEDVVDEVARLIEASFAVDLHHSTDTQRFTGAGSFGDRSMHYVCALPDAGPLGPRFGFESQVRTALQHAGAQVEDDLGSRPSAEVPDAIHRRDDRRRARGTSPSSAKSSRPGSAAQPPFTISGATCCLGGAVPASLRVTVMRAETRSPVMPVAMASSALAPSASGTVAAKPPAPSNSPCTPLTLTLATSNPRTVPYTVTVSVVMVAPSIGSTKATPNSPGASSPGVSATSCASCWSTGTVSVSLAVR